MLLIGRDSGHRCSPMEHGSDSSRDHALVLKAFASEADKHLGPRGPLKSVDRPILPPTTVMSIYGPASLTESHASNRYLDPNEANNGIELAAL